MPQGSDPGCLERPGAMGYVAPGALTHSQEGSGSMAPEMQRMSIPIWFAAGALAAVVAGHGPALAQQSPRDVVSAVVRLSADIPPDARTAATLGTRREGNGVVIDDSGLVLTIGYLILEAVSVTVANAGGEPIPADLVAYDHESGFGLVRARVNLGVAPIKLGDSRALEEKEPVLVVAHGGLTAVRGANVASRREFAGYWEYLLDDAIFTVPPHPGWGGAALVGRDGTLLGIGSLIVNDALEGNVKRPGNMFVPIDLLKPILADLLTDGRRAGPRRPWLGMFSTSVPGGALVTRVAPGGPAEQAGIEPGDIVGGVAGESVGGLSDLYRKVWAHGEAGVKVPLSVRRGSQAITLTVTSGNRETYLRLRPSD